MATGEQTLALCRDIDWRSGEAFSLAILGQVWIAAGDFGKALTLLQQSIAICEEIDHRQWMIQARWGLAQLYGAMQAPDLERAELEYAFSLCASDPFPGLDEHGRGGPQLSPDPSAADRRSGRGVAAAAAGRHAAAHIGAAAALAGTG